MVFFLPRRVHRPSIFPHTCPPAGGKTRTPFLSGLHVLPDTHSHPVILSGRLLQYAICLLQLPLKFERERLNFDGHWFCEFLTSWVGAACTFTSSDDLVDYLEGVECLVLESMFAGDGGRLRKSWMTIRRALNMA